MLPMVIGLLLRHALTAGGAIAASKGMATNSDAEAIVGAAVTLAGLLWSAWQKYQQQKKDQG